MKEQPVLKWMPSLGFVWWVVVMRAGRVNILMPGRIMTPRRKDDDKETRSEVILEEKVGTGGGYGENRSEARICK